ncbi:MAG: recombinase family protein [Niabella sp.]
MSSAILYLRVSTDEQASKGYSLKYQEDVLAQYCNLKNITILKTFKEDHSAKSFDRPAWKRLMQEIEGKGKKLPNLILFTKWDRFSRNTGDSYSMIRTLQKLSLEPQAIEQPLDLSVPENKMMLAFYLAVPEVENDRRGLNVKYGMHKAREEGRWMGRAPLGYANHCTPDGSKYIASKEPEASIIKHVFEQLAEGRLNVNQAYLQAIKLGLACSRSNFCSLMHNPVYAGYVRVKDLDNNIQLVPAQHLGIISMSMFEKVQILITRKKQRPRFNKSFNPELLLKGYISCPRCSRTLTGSGSTGRSGTKYYYYHCNSNCGFRIRTAHTHNVFFQRIMKFFPAKIYIASFREILSDAYEQQKQEILQRQRKAIKGIEMFTDRILKLKSLLLDGYINFEDYQLTKEDIEAKIQLLSDAIASYSYDQSGINNKIELAVDEFCNPYLFFTTLNNALKQEFVNNLLHRNWQWSEAEFDGIFKRLAHIIYESYKNNGPGESIKQAGEIHSFLKKWAQMTLRKNIQTENPTNVSNPVCPT